MNDQPPALLSITVSGSTGSITKSLTGSLVGIGVIGPVNAVYDVSLADADGFPLPGASGITTQKAYIQVLAHLYGSITVTLSNASNGVYSVKLFYKQY